MTERELIFTSVLNLDRTQLYLGDYRINNRHAGRLADIFLQRARGRPLQYILGKADFFGLEFEVNGSVFIPRFETEILVETAIELARQNSLFKILDVGTGSGCIAISIAKNIQQAVIDALDISLSALTVARKNASNHNVDGRVRFLNGDLFPPGGSYGLIVSNPPYIRRGDLCSLPQKVKQEPLIALDGGDDGLDFYRRIAKGVNFHLEEGGFLLMEMGCGQAEEVRDILKELRLFDRIELIKDYSNIERVIVARKKGK